jgi:acyl dehydratase
MAELPRYDAVRVGDALPPLAAEPVSRLTLALYCGASGDHNPIHVDLDYARAAGLDDVIAHGMLSMAYLGRMLTAWVPQSAIRRFATRFAAVTHIGERIGCRGTIVEKLAGREVRIELIACNDAGEQKLVGDAVVTLG